MSIVLLGELHKNLCFQFTANFMMHWINFPIIIDAISVGKL